MISIAGYFQNSCPELHCGIVVTVHSYSYFKTLSHTTFITSVKRTENIQLYIAEDTEETTGRGRV